MVSNIINLHKFAIDYSDAVIQASPVINNTILSSDCGLSILPIPVEGFAKFLLTIKKQGFSEKEIKIMSSINPSILFKIEDCDSNK